jgi:hypothetical protein
MQVLYDSHGKVIGSTGMFGDLLSVLQKRLNFSLETIVGADGTWGRVLVEGSKNEWTGLIGTLVRGEADMVTGGLTQTLQRSR